MLSVIANRQKELLKLLTQAGCNHGWQHQGHVLSGQVGHYSRVVYKAAAYPHLEAAHKADLRRALGDTILQSQICCELLGFDANEVFLEAFIAFRDEMKSVIIEKQKQNREVKE